MIVAEGWEWAGCHALHDSESVNAEQDGLANFQERENLHQTPKVCRVVLRLLMQVKARKKYEICLRYSVN